MKKLLLLCSLFLLGAGCANNEKTEINKANSPQPVSTAEKKDNTVKNVSTSTLKAELDQLRETFGKAGRPSTKEEIEAMTEEGKAACEKAHGTWKSLAGCGDVCMFQRTPALRATCPSVNSYGCDCGEDKCWSGSSCENN